MAVTISFSADTRTLVISDDIVRNPIDTEKALQKINHRRINRNHNGGTGLGAARLHLAGDNSSLSYITKVLDGYNLLSIKAVIRLPYEN